MIISGLLIFNPASSLATYGDGGAGVGTSTSTGGGGGSSGPIIWYVLKNTTFATKPYGGGGGQSSSIPGDADAKLGGSRVDAQFLDDNRKQAAGAKGSRIVTQSVLANCFNNSNLNPNANGCPLLNNVGGKRTNTAATINWARIHFPYPKKSEPMPAAGRLIAYNIKIWRENRNPNKGPRGFDLIFERRVNLKGGSSIGNGNQFTGQQYWWYGGSTASAHGSNKGGVFSIPQSSAGPIGNYSAADNARQDCVSNYSKGTNGRLSLNGTSQGKPIYQYGRKAKFNGRPRNGLPGNSCYWEGARFADRPFKWSVQQDPQVVQRFERNEIRINGKKLPDNQFGPNTRSKLNGNKCKLGVTCAGLKESFFFSWNIPLASSNKPSWNFKLEGAPGLYYAVQISGMDNREATVPITKPNNFTWGREVGPTNISQYFRVYVSNPIPPTPTPGCPPSNPYYPTCVADPPEYPKGTPPDVNVQLIPETPVQTRQQTEQQIDITTNEYTDEQAVFPIKSELIHYTPQMRFSSPAAAQQSSGFNAYDANFINYGYLNGSEPSKTATPAAFSAPTPSDKPAFNAQEVHLTQALDLEDGNQTFVSDGSASLATNQYLMTWLQPTLNSPCNSDPMDIDDVLGVGANRNSGQAFSWPADPQKCSINNKGWVNRFNAWDDLLRATASWEAQWVDDGAKNMNEDGYTQGLINNQPMRCATKSNNPRRLDNCPQPSYGLLTNILNSSSQKAQGSLNIDGPDPRNAGMARVVFDTNRPNKVTKATVAESGNMARKTYTNANGPAGIINTLTNTPELNFCEQGLPIGSTINNKNNNKDVQIDNKDSRRGDPGCRGYALRWTWPAVAANEIIEVGEQYAGVCNANKNKFQANEPSSSNIAGRGLPNHSQVTGTLSGKYGQADSRQGTSRAYNPNSFKGPFSGKRPGKEYNNTKDCKKRIPGHYEDGSWNRKFDFRILTPTANNCKFKAGEINGFDKPNNSAENGTATKCTTANGYKATYKDSSNTTQNYYSFGYWYPIRVNWKWDTDTCKAGLNNRSQTTIGSGGSKRNSPNKFFYSSVPSASGGLGRSANNLVANNPNQSPSNADFNSYFDESAWGCKKVHRGYFTQGSWKVNNNADSGYRVQRGWGNNNSGKRLSDNTYLFTFEFNGLTSEDLAYGSRGSGPAPAANAPLTNNGRCPLYQGNTAADEPGTCWNMTGTYEGYDNFKWVYQQQQSGRYDNSSYIKVFGPRDSR
jgi:hypothetical protein